MLGIDLTGTETDPTGWTLWKNKAISACHLQENKQILDRSLTLSPTLIAIDATSASYERQHETVDKK